MKLSFLTKALIKTLETSYTPQSAGGDTITISRTVSALASLYEKIRVAIEYREDHLLRRAAIERIIKRRLILNENGKGISEYLVRELLWAHYMPENSIASSKIAEVQIIIDKYLYLRNILSKGKNFEERAVMADWLISSAAAEVEEKLAPNTRREAFINFIFQYYKNKVFLLEETDETRDVQVYIAVHRAFAKSNDDYIRYHLLKLMYPSLTKLTWKDMKGRERDFHTTLTRISRYLKHPIGQKLNRAVQKEIAPFLVLRDVYEKNQSSFTTILEDEDKLAHEVTAVCKKRYEEIQERLKNAGTRSIIYIFATKMIFAVGIEYPVEKYILDHINWVALGINILFPPLLMFLVLLGIKPPGTENTDRIIMRLKDIIYQDSDSNHKIILTLKADKRRPVMQFIFALMYVAAYIIVFGGIIWGLTVLDFSFVSQGIFIFFVSVVVFFAYRVRQTGKEYILGRPESVISPIVNFLFLPILSLGKWLSNEVARFNFFIAIFDYLIEAPFKGIIEVFEEWFSFMRKQKEEIL